MRSSADIGKIVRRQRGVNKIRQMDFAEKMGIHKSTLSKYESGQRKIPMEDISKMAEILDMNVEDLLIEKDKPTPLPVEPIPVVSQISAGDPIYGEENIVEYTYVPEGLSRVGKKLFGLKVSGDSMDREFKENDVVIVEKDAMVENGQIGVVLVNGYDATVKRIRYDDDRVILYPESNNPAHIPQVYNGKDELSIVGRVVSSQKFY